MANYDWSKVSREQLEMALAALDAYESRVDDIPTEEPEGKALVIALGHARAEALVTPLRTRAEVNQELAELARLWIDDAGTSGNEVRWHKMQALRGEPTKD